MSKSSSRLNMGKSLFKDYIKHYQLLLLLLPAIVYFIVFKYIPMAGVVLAFKKFRIMKGIWASPWVGWTNFEVLFSTPGFWQALKNTLLLSGLNLIVGFPAPIIFALLLNEIQHVRVKKVVQTISYLPHFLSWVVLSGILTQFLSPSAGPVNYIIKLFGGKPIYFLGDPSVFRGTLVGTAIWQSVGWSAIVYMAALSGIDPTLYEAADIDGATRIKKMIYITLPSITPVITITLILAVGKIINDNFDQVYNLYNPGVYSVGEVLSTYIYKRGINNMQYEVSTAMNLFQNLISLILILITNWISKGINEYGLW